MASRALALTGPHGPTPSRLDTLSYYSAGERVRVGTSRGATGRSPGVDEDGNTYQRRVLESGAEIAICELQYYWYATYEVFR
jgi:hypothetical protein